MEKFAEQFQGFMKEKQDQVLNNVLTSAVPGWVLANGVLFIAGDASIAVGIGTA